MSPELGAHILEDNIWLRLTRLGDHSDLGVILAHRGVLRTGNVTIHPAYFVDKPGYQTPFVLNNQKLRHYDNYSVANIYL